MKVPLSIFDISELIEILPVINILLSVLYLLLQCTLHFVAHYTKSFSFLFIYSLHHPVLQYFCTLECFNKINV